MRLPPERRLRTAIGLAGETHRPEAVRGDHDTGLGLRYVLPGSIAPVVRRYLNAA
jgi:hypothetical protein